MKLPWRRGERSLGQSMVEFALILPLFALFLVIAVDFGRIYFSYVQVNNAAREGAAFGALSPTDTVGIQGAAKQETDAQGQTGETALTVATQCKDSTGLVLADCALATGAAGPGSTITVTVSEKFNFITPLANSFFSNNLVMKTTATATVLGYAAGTGGGGGGGTTCSPPVPEFSVVVTTGLTIHVDPPRQLPTPASAPSPATTGRGGTATTASGAPWAMTTPTSTPGRTRSRSKPRTRLAPGPRSTP